MRLLADGKLYAADANFNKLQDVYSPILAVFSQELAMGRMEYKISNQKCEVVLYLSNIFLSAYFYVWC